MHIGPVKTGTSAVQSVLCEHDNSAVIYPKVGLWGSGSHHGLVYGFFGETMRGKEPADPEQLFRQIAASVNDTDTNVLVSSEMFAPPPGSKRAKKRNLGAFVETLLKHFDGDWSVEVLVACRDHFERAASAYSQRIKGKDALERAGPDEYLLRYADELQYAPLIEAARAFGYKVTALNYHPAQSWTMRFLSYVGFRSDDVPRSQSTNVSPSVKALIAKLSANRTLESADERHRFLKLLKQMPGYAAPSEFIFGSGAVAATEPRFSEDRSFLRREFGLELPNDGTRENMFFLDARSFEEIDVVARMLGPPGNAILEAAREYLRPAIMGGL